MQTCRPREDLPAFLPTCVLNPPVCLSVWPVCVSCWCAVLWRRTSVSAQYGVEVIVWRSGDEVVWRGGNEVVWCRGDEVVWCRCVDIVCYRGGERVD